MYRFLLRPKWIGFHVLVVAGIVALVSLGFWQLRRLDERRDFNARVEARTDLPPAPLDEVLASGPPDEIEWRTVTVTGRYLPDEQFVIVNRSQGGRAGENVATPLDVGDGRTLIVNRGFVPLTVDVPPAPVGAIDVVGRVRQSQARRTGQLSDPSAGELTEVQRLDIPRLEPQLPGDVVPVYVDLLVSQPAEAPGLPDPVQRPPLGEGPHLSYAVQWFIFSLCVAIGWVLAVRRSIRTRRREDVRSADVP
jgi:cytochrome oxidase assembly protein ShyY1